MSFTREVFNALKKIVPDFEITELQWFQLLERVREELRPMLDHVTFIPLSKWKIGIYPGQYVSLENLVDMKKIHFEFDRGLSLDTQVTLFPMNTDEEERTREIESRIRMSGSTGSSRLHWGLSRQAEWLLIHVSNHATMLDDAIRESPVSIAVGRSTVQEIARNTEQSYTDLAGNLQGWLGDRIAGIRARAELLEGVHKQLRAFLTLNSVLSRDNDKQKAR